MKTWVVSALIFLQFSIKLLLILSSSVIIIVALKLPVIVMVFGLLYIVSYQNFEVLLIKYTKTVDRNFGVCGQ
ncbi:hypothetical protein BJ170DRAFT_609018 [Xylariales sp. AK1849]|nr:hypothetical protein BJ170DRAFT_609018 [Xylariales sp. AK1849]